MSKVRTKAQLRIVRMRDHAFEMYSAAEQLYNLTAPWAYASAAEIQAARENLRQVLAKARGES